MCDERHTTDVGEASTPSNSDRERPQELDEEVTKASSAREATGITVLDEPAQLRNDKKGVRARFIMSLTESPTGSEHTLLVARAAPHVTGCLEYHCAPGPAMKKDDELERRCRIEVSRCVNDHARSPLGSESRRVEDQLLRPRGCR